MTETVRFLDSIGRGVELIAYQSGYDYFDKYTQISTPTKIVNTFATSDFNGFGIDRVVQTIMRTADSATIKFFDGETTMISVSGSRTDVGQWQDYLLEDLMDGFFWSGTKIVATSFADTITGGSSGDIVFGGGGDDVIDSGGYDFSSIVSDRDMLSGGSGSDTLIGHEDADTLDGGKGRDLINGGIGGDSLTGGSGQDRFVFNNYGGKDTITDFATADDRIMFGEGVSRGSLKIAEVEGGVMIKAGYGLSILLEGADLTDIQDHARFIFS